MKRWMQKKSKANNKQIAEVLHIQEATACVLANRGISTYEEAVQFLSPKSAKNVDFLTMKGVAKALDMVGEAIQLQKKIMIYGDYDVGATRS